MLHKRNQTHAIAVTKLPYEINFAYDIPNYGVQLAPEGLAVAVTTNSSVAPAGLGATDILISQYESSLNLKATTVISTIKQDNMTSFFVQKNGGFVVVGITSGNLNSPASNSVAQNSVFAIQFERLGVKAVISSQPKVFMVNEYIEIQFDSIPSSLTSVIPVVTFGSKNCTNVQWNSGSLFAQIPLGVGGPFDLWILFNSLIHFNPKLRIDGYSYEPPTITSISPVTGPSVGFNLTINASKLGVPNQDPVVVTIGSKLCLNTIQLDVTRIRCTVPPGAGKNHLVVVSVGPVSNSTQRVFISYDPPNVFSIMPTTGPTAGGNWIFIIGNGFGTCNGTSPCNAFTAGVLATIGSKPCSDLLLHNDTHINCRVPEGSDSRHLVSVTVLGQMTNTSASYSYQKPNISIVIPSSLVSRNPKAKTLAQMLQTSLSNLLIWLHHNRITAQASYGYHIPPCDVNSQLLAFHCILASILSFMLVI
ncbi:hypothetical protein BKA69DRAFT_174063 [Paraphysoderma sedebokerense]|nr:hypothetical protein BKA69DRAFT_174063 [Paraphysoderma sedebokerense]